MARERNIGLPVNDSECKGISYLSRELPDDYYKTYRPRTRFLQGNGFFRIDSPNIAAIGQLLWLVSPRV